VASGERIGGIVLAGGSGTRFGGPKQIAELGGRPLLDYALEAAAAALDRVVLVLGARADEVRERVDLRGAEVVVCADWEGGMAETLKAGLRALGDVDAAVVTLGDQPLVGAAAIERVLAARDGDALAVRATYDGEPGHPVVLERELFPRLLKLSGDVGARAVLASASVRVRSVPCEDVADRADVDSPADLRRIEARLTGRAG
jgi:CTP:molybdopterin cytidylyltransferase MocA